MSGHWWRAYDDGIEHPKLQRLAPTLFRTWYNLMCLTSANGGVLPSIADVAFKLRMSEAKAAESLQALRDAVLFEETETGWRPHNWDKRQFKSDVSTERVQRFRKRPRNVSSTVSETPPDTDTEYRKKDAADAAPDPEADYFRRGKEIVGDSAGGLLAKLLKAKGRKVAVARAAVEIASTKQNPREYLGAVIAGGQPSENGKRLSNDDAFYGPGRIPGII